MKKIAGLLVVFFAMTTGCGGDDATAEPSVNEEGCEHMVQGPSVPLTASAAVDMTTPAVNADHKRYDVTLVDDMSGAKTGFVSFASREAVDFLFFLSASVPLAIQDSAGMPVAIEDSQTSIAECTEVKGRHQVALGVGTYHLRFGPTMETSVNVVVEEASGHAH